MTEIDRKLKTLEIALEGLRDLESARTKFTDCELPTEEIEKFKKKTIRGIDREIDANFLKFFSH